MCHAPTESSILFSDWLTLYWTTLKMHTSIRRWTHDVNGEYDSDNETNDDIRPVIVVETVAGKATQQRHHHEAECNKRTQNTRLATGARHIVNVNLRKANIKTFPVLDCLSAFVWRVLFVLLWFSIHCNISWVFNYRWPALMGLGPTSSLPLSL